MPPKRRAAGTTAKSHQSTLAFHGASNKVTKSGPRAENAKKNIVVDQPAAQDAKPETAHALTVDSTEPTTAEAAVIEQARPEVVASHATSTPEEDEARKVSEAKIKKYWAGKENERKAPRVHQKDLSIHEKVLREFDMSGQYGPCVGIARLKRWKRAHRLNLDPPIEVLAVLLKEQEDKDGASVQTSHVDELLKSRNTEVDIGE